MDVMEMEFVLSSVELLSVHIHFFPKGLRAMMDFLSPMAIAVLHWAFVPEMTYATEFLAPRQ
jgi:hypothetical protein